MSEIPALFAQRPIILRHQRAGMYHPMVEALAMTAVDIPFTFITIAVFSLILYFSVRLQQTAAQFLYASITNHSEHELINFKYILPLRYISHDHNESFLQRTCCFIQISGTCSSDRRSSAPCSFPLHWVSNSSAQYDRSVTLDYLD